MMRALFVVPAAMVLIGCGGGDPKLPGAGMPKADALHAGPANPAPPNEPVTGAPGSQIPGATTGGVVKVETKFSNPTLPPLSEEVRPRSTPVNLRPPPGANPNAAPVRGNLVR